MSLKALPDSLPTDDLRVIPPVEAAARVIPPDELARLIQQERDARVATATAEFQAWAAAFCDKYNVQLMPAFTFRADGRQSTQILVEIRG